MASRVTMMTCCHSSRVDPRRALRRHSGPSPRGGLDVRLPREAPGLGRRSFLARATLAGAATLAPGLAHAGAIEPEAQPLVNPAKPMPETVTAEEIRTLLKLEPNQDLRLRARDL